MDSFQNIEFISFEANNESQDTEIFPNKSFSLPREHIHRSISRHFETLDDNGDFPEEGPSSLPKYLEGFNLNLNESTNSGYQDDYMSCYSESYIPDRLIEYRPLSLDSLSSSYLDDRIGDKIGDKLEDRMEVFSNTSTYPERVYRCKENDCGKIYKSKENLTLHIKNIHLNLKPYKCTFCPAVFSHRNGKTYHERKFHTKYLPHKCPYKSKLIFNP